MSSHAKRPLNSPKASPSKASKQSKRNPEFTILTPAPDAAPWSIRRMNRLRTEEKVIEKEEQLLYKLAQKYKEQAQVIRTPFTCRSLQKNADVTHLQEICNKELALFPQLSVPQNLEIGGYDKKQPLGNLGISGYNEIAFLET
ncbi:hypothetical protein BDZ97DRAFT_1925133 [Flammula alnicola]|nr:hypothetical protein BDZ97DRAFT_1925133 [Flammula alnicola]